MKGRTNPLATNPTLEIRKVYESEFGTIEKIYSWNGVSLFQYYWCYSTALDKVIVNSSFSESLGFLAVVFTLKRMSRFCANEANNLFGSVVKAIDAISKLNNTLIMYNRQPGKRTLIKFIKYLTKPNVKK